MAINFYKIPDNNVVILTKNLFIDLAEGQYIEDKCGLVYMADEHYMSDIMVKPSKIAEGRCYFPDWCTRVVIFPYD